MKKINIFTLIFCCAILIVSCEKKTGSAVLPASIAPTALTQEEIPAPNMIISLQEAEDMYHRYGTTTASLIEETINIDREGNPIAESSDQYVQATRSLSIDYKKLKEYLAFIEQEAGSANTDISGVRIYFSQYKKGENDGRASVFLNPLMEAGKKGDIRDDVSFAIATSRNKSKAVPVGKLIKVPTTTSNKANLTMSIQDGVQSLAGNHFPWSPPPTDDPDDFQ